MVIVPKVLLDFLGYTFYFYSNENGEPIHIHVSKGRPSENSAKFWIKRDGVILEHKMCIRDSNCCEKGVGTKLSSERTYEMGSTNSCLLYTSFRTLVKVIGTLIRIAATIVIAALAIIGLAGLIYPAPRTELFKIGTEMYLQLSAWIPK